MDVRVNKNDKMVEWDVGGKTISIYNEYTLYAFKHGKGMLMIKENMKHQIVDLVHIMKREI